MRKAFRLAAMLAALVPAAPLAAEPEAALTIVAGVTGGEQSDAGIWFTLWERGVRFVAGGGGDGVDAMWRALREAADEGRSVAVSFDAVSGRFDPATGQISYRACAVRARADGPAPRALACATRSPPGALADLTSGVAYAVAGDKAVALPRLERALAAADLDPRARITALRLRGSIRSGLADEAAGVEADRLLMGALADDRAWAALAPDDPDAASAVAANLTDLGDYEGAIAAYRAIVRRWSDQDFSASVRIGAIERIRRDYPRALAALDEFVKRSGPQTGMKFHYHRGWTLGLLGRYDEAVAELTTGIGEQPDYYAAYLRRACANGQSGHVAAAIIDQRAAIRLLAALVADSPSTWAKDELKQVERVADALVVADRERPGRPTDVACLGYRDPQPLRTRSPLLAR